MFLVMPACGIDAFDYGLRGDGGGGNGLDLLRFDGVFADDQLLTEVFTKKLVDKSRFCTFGSQAGSFMLLQDLDAADPGAGVFDPQHDHDFAAVAVGVDGIDVTVSLPGRLRAFDGNDTFA